MGSKGTELSGHLLYEIAVACPIHELFCQSRWHVEVAGNVTDLFNDISGMAAAKLKIMLLIELRLNVVHNNWIVDNVPAPAIILEYIFVLLQCGIFKMNLIANTPEEG